MVAASVDPDTAVAVADQALKRDAIKWASKSKEQSFIAKLLDTLPPAALDEQVRLYQASECGPVVPHAPSGNRGASALAEVEARSRTVV